eukprot:6613555-Pyramimonas_sp.AAC.1
MNPREPLSYWLEPVIGLLRGHLPDPQGPVLGDEGSFRSKPKPWTPTIQEAGLLRAIVGGGL